MGENAVTPQQAPAEATRENVKVTLVAGAPQLTRILLAREPSVVPEDDYEYNLQFSLGLVRPHARHLQLELIVAVSAIPWAQRNQIVVSYEMGYLIRGHTSTATGEAIVLDIARRIGPSALFPFIRETVQSITAKAGSAIMLPMVDWHTEFPNDMEIPAPLGETPPEFLEAIE